MRRLLLGLTLMVTSLVGAAVPDSVRAAASDDSAEYLEVATLPDGGALVLGSFRGTYGALDAGDGTALFVEYHDDDGAIAWTEKLDLDLSCVRPESGSVDVLARRVRSANTAYFMVTTCDWWALVSADASGVNATRPAGPDAGSFGASTFAADPTGGVQLVARAAPFDPDGQNPWTLFSYDEQLEIRFATELPGELLDPRQVGVEVDDGDDGHDRESISNLVAPDGTGWVVGTERDADGVGSMVLLAIDSDGAVSRRVEHAGYGCVEEFAPFESQMRALQVTGGHVWVATCELRPFGEIEDQQTPLILALDAATGAIIGEVALPEEDVSQPRFTDDFSPARFSGDGRLAITNDYRGPVLWEISGELADTTWEPITLSVAGDGTSRLYSADTLPGSDGYIAVGWTLVDPDAEPDPNDEFGGEFAPHRPEIIEREFPALRSDDPMRVLDTRDGASRPTAGSMTEVPLAIDAAAVVANVTVVRPDADGFATIGPCSDQTPTVSSVNFVTGRTASNTSTTTVDAAAGLCVYTSADAHLLVDVTARFVDTPSFGSMEPTRLVDSRDTQIVVGDTTLRVPVTEHPEIDADAAHVVVNATAVRPTERGFLTLWSCDGERPPVSSVNFEAGETTPNQAIVEVGTAGEICMYASVDTHVLVDAAAWLGAEAGLRTGEPVRFLDTRPNGVTFDGRAAGSTGTAGRLVADEEFVFSVRRAPTGRFNRVIVMNVAVTNPSEAGHLSIWPCGDFGPPGDGPNVSSVNFVPGQPTSNSVVMEIPSTPWLCFQSTADYDLVLDLMTSG